MASYRHPGVFIEELQAPPTIEGVPTSIPLFVGVTDNIPGITPPATPTLVTSWSSYVNLFGPPIWYGLTSWAVREFFAESGGYGQCYVYKVTQPIGSFAKLISGTDIKGIRAASGGNWGNNIGIILTTSDWKTDITGYGTLVTLNVAVIRLNLPTTPAPNPVDTSLLARYIDQNPSLRTLTVGSDEWTVLESFTGFWPEKGSMSADMAKAINSTSMFIRIDDPVAATRPVGGALKTVPLLNNGNNDKSKNPCPFIFPFDDANKDVVLRVPGISLLAAPEIPTLADSTGLSAVAAQHSKALTFCENSNKLFYVIDCPFFLSVQEIINFKSGAITGNISFTNEKPPSGLYSPKGFGAAYYPTPDILDPRTANRVPVTISGPVLGRYAFADGRIGVQKAAAGTTDGLLRTVVGLATDVSDNQQDLLNPQHINAIRKITPYGNLIWGARTIAQPGSEWTHVPVRRLLIQIEQSLLAALPWVLFDLNGPQLWEAVKREVTDFLTGLWNAGALAGTTQNEAFYVVCDNSNNTEKTIEEGYLYVSVGVSPTHPAEFVVVQVAQKLATSTSGS